MNKAIDLLERGLKRIPMAKGNNEAEHITWLNLSLHKQERAMKQVLARLRQQRRGDLADVIGLIKNARNESAKTDPNWATIQTFLNKAWELTEQALARLDTAEQRAKELGKCYESNKETIATQGKVCEERWNRICDLESELDAECRVSQMLLAEQKRLQAELASARKENKRVREVLEEAWGPIEELVTQCASDVATACWPSGFGYSEKDVKRINKTIQQTLSKSK